MKTTAAALIMSVVGLCAVPAQAGTGDHIDQLADALRRQTANVANDVRYHFRNTPQYRHLYNDVYEMYQLAEHVHEVAHFDNSYAHLKEDVAELDRLFHHVEELVAEMQATSAPTHHHHYGHGGFQVHIGGFGHGNYHLDRLCRQLEQIEDTLHHLESDVDTLRPVYGGPGYFPSQPAPVIIPSQPAPVVVPSYQDNGWNWRPARRNGGVGISFSIR